MKRKRQNNIPILAICNSPVNTNITGAWRNVRPVYSEKTPPCRESCPAGEDIEGVMTLVAAKKYTDAWQLIREENPFPAVCGRVCYHPCEGGCNRGYFDEPLSINAIERFVADTAYRNKILKSGKCAPSRKDKVAVIGAGPAGLTGAYHLAKRGFRVTLYEAFNNPGGILTYGIPSYRLPKDILKWEIGKIADTGVEINCGKVLGKDIKINTLLNGFDAVLLATGAAISRKIGVLGEGSANVIDGSKFLRDISAGRASHPGKRVAVIGGGNTAVDVARSAARLGSNVSVMYRRTRMEMGAFPEEISDALEEGVQLKFLVAPVKFISGSDGKLKSIRFIKMKLGSPDSSGRRKPVVIENSEFEENFDAAIIAIGEDIDYSLIKISKDASGFNPDIKRGGIITNMDRVFAAGDYTGGARTVVDAIAGGKESALAIESMLDGKNYFIESEKIKIGDGGISLYSRINNINSHIKKLNTVVEYQNINIDYFQQGEPPVRRKLTVDKRKNEFSEVHFPVSRVEAVAEAMRCFNCGRCTECDNCYKYCPDISVLRKVKNGINYEIDYDHCKGCGICTAECPRDVIDMIEEFKS